MLKHIFPVIFSLLFLVSCGGTDFLANHDKPLQGLNITIDPGHGATRAYDNFRVGPAGEREEWINLRVAKYLTKKLTRAGADVLLTRAGDRDISLGGRATLAKRHQSDLLVSIHHNGSGNDPDIDLPIVYFFGPASKNPASVDFGHILLAEMRKQMVFEQPSAGAVYSDHLIYSSGTSILRNTIELMPGVIGEGGFFTNPAGERRLRSRAYNKLEAEVYFQAILTYFDRGLPTATPVIPDSLKYLDLNDRVQFQLDDGFGSHFFDGTSFEIFQNGEPLKAAWDEMLGILSAAPVPTQEQQVSFQVFGRNFKGNSIHPVAFNFLTETGDLWYSVDSWRTAFQRADSLLLAYNSVDSSDVPEKTRLLDETLHHYQLSLELQIVHPKARLAEVRILDLLEQKQKLLKLDLAEQLNIQRQILLEYYPQ